MLLRKVSVVDSNQTHVRRLGRQLYIVLTLKCTKLPKWQRRIMGWAPDRPDVKIKTMG